jgi:hypothetical protein
MILYKHEIINDGNVEKYTIKLKIRKLICRHNNISNTSFLLNTFATGLLMGWDGTKNRSMDKAY